MTDETDDQTIDMDLSEPEQAAPDEERDDEEPDEPEDDSEEVEHDGQKYRIPKALKGALLMQQDYTRQTQELADIRKSTELERAAIKQAVEADEAASEIKSDLRILDKALKQYDNVDWQAFAAEQPAQAQAAMLRYQQMQMQKAQLADGLTQHEQSSRQARDQAQQAAIAQAARELQALMPDLTPELENEIWQSTASSYGLQPESIRATVIGNPKVTQLMRDAMMWRKSQEAAKTAAKPKPATEPVKTVRPSSKTTVNPDKMTTAEWMAYERKRITQKGR